MKALIVHSRRTGVGLIRSLGRKGIDVYTADVFKAPGFYSKYTKKGFIVPQIIGNSEQQFVDELVSIGKEVGGGERIFLFTASDDYLLLFVKHWEILKSYYFETFEINLLRLEDNLEKTKMYNISQKANVPYPKSYYSPVNTCDIIEFPVVVKPTLKKTSSVDVIKEAFRIKFCDNEQELKEGINQLSKIGIGYVVQHYIEGGDDQLYTAGIFAYKGNLVASATGRKIRQFPPMTGECSFGELVEEPKIIEYAKRYVETSKITGVCQVEFKKNKGEFYLMEINPRPWSWNSLMDYAGVNLPYIACKTMLDPENIKYYDQKRFKGTWMFSYMDVRHNVIENKNISFFKWLKDSIFASVHAFGSIKDPIPSIVAIYQNLKYG